MIIFDVLDKLENYAPVIPHMDRVIDIMDHSKPYNDDAGEYSASKDGEVKYLVSVEVSTQRGTYAQKRQGKTVLEIVLEGEEIVSLSGSPFCLSPGLFLTYDGDDDVKRGIAKNLPSPFKAVRFFL